MIDELRGRPRAPPPARRSTSTRCSRCARRSSAAGVQLLGYFGAARRAVRQLRHLPRRRPSPGTARSPRRSCCPRSCGCSASAARSSAPGTSSTSCSASRPPKVEQFGHDALRVVRHRRRPRASGEWRGVVRQLLAQGLLAVEGELRHARADRGQRRPVLRGERARCMLRREPERPARAAKSRGGRAPPRSSCPPEAAPVFERLRAWRGGRRRKEQGVPAYVVFHDATLREIATQAPGDAWPSSARSAASARTSSRSTATACSQPWPATEAQPWVSAALTPQVSATR